MRIEKRKNNIYVKALSEIEAYLLNIIKRFFDQEEFDITDTREDIILEAIRRAKEDIVLENGAVQSVNKMTGHVTLDASDVGAEPIIQKKTAFNKNFGSKAGTVCEGNDPRLDKSDYYTKNETDEKINEVRKKTTGVKFVIGENSWVYRDGSYYATLKHNLNLGIEAFNIAFYNQENKNLCLNYRIIGKNSIEIISPENLLLTVVLRQAIVSTVFIPDDIRRQIEINAENIATNTGDIKKNSDSIKTIKSDITSMGSNISTNSNNIRNLTSEVSNVKESITNLDENKSDIDHSHNIEDLDNLEKYIFKKNWGELNTPGALDVQIKKANGSALNLAVGLEAELIFNRTYKTIHVMDGETLGGIALSKVGHTHDYNELENTPEYDLYNYYTKDETYSSEQIDDILENLGQLGFDINDYSTKEEVSQAIKELNSLINSEGPSEELPHGNIAYNIFENKNNIKELKRKVIVSTKHLISVDDWTYDEETELYEYIYTHNEDTEIDMLDISFYIDNQSYIFDYEYVDSNNIKIFSIENVDLTVCTRNRIGYRLDSMDDDGEIEDSGNLDYDVPSDGDIPPDNIIPDDGGEYID